MSVFAIDSQVKVNCYLSCDFSDEKYWFARDKSKKNASQPLFTGRIFDLPLSMKELKSSISDNLTKDEVKFHKLNEGEDGQLKNFILLLVQDEREDRKKSKSTNSIWKHICKVLPESIFFAVGECASTMDIIIMTASTKSHSTNVRGGSATSPLSIISLARSPFLLTQIEQCKLGKPLKACFDRLEFKGNKACTYVRMIMFPLLVLIDNIIGTHDQRKTSLSALFSNHCSAADLYCDAEIAASGDRCNATLVVQRIEVIIQSLDVNSQLPLNCTFKRDGKNAREWRRQQDEEEDAKNEDEKPTEPVRKRVKVDAQRPSCGCQHRGNDTEGRFCGHCDNKYAWIAVKF
jgi:hypothetical protein